MAATCQDILRWGRIDPYFVWAEATGYAGMLRPEGHWIPVIAAGDAGSLEKLWAGMRESQDQPGRVYGVPAAKEAVFFTLLLGSDVRCAVLELLSRSGVRWELGLPVASPDAPLRADQPEEMRAEEPPAEFTGRARSSDRQVIGFIDYGCAFAHTQFRRWEGRQRTDASRVFALWDQESPMGVAPRSGYTPPDWAPVPGFGYGRQWRRRARSSSAAGLGIDAYMRQFVRNGTLAEEACYAMSGYRAIQCPVAHGTFIMDIAAGYPSPLLPPGQPDSSTPDEDIVFVQLPRLFRGTPVTGLLRSYVLDAVNYIFSCALPQQPVTINLSYGAYAGSHDGTSILEEALDAAITRRRSAGGPTDIVIAAGNGADSRTHVEDQLTAAGGAHAQTGFRWANIPDNPTDQFTEVWLFGDATDGCEVRFTPPGQEPDESGWVARGQSREIRRDGELVAMVVAPRDVCQGRHGRMVLLAVAPTVRRGERAAAPYGRWNLEVRNTGTGKVTVKAWIERDDPVFMSAAGPRQARFEDTTASGASDTLNSVASGKETIVVGGLVGDSGRTPEYSAKGPAGGAPSKPRPEWLAVCEESDALPGIAAATVTGHDRVRLPGTSVSAAVATRYVVAKRRGGTDTGPVKAPELHPPVALPVVPSPLNRHGHGHKHKRK